LGVEGDAVVVLKNFDDMRADIPVRESTSDEEINGFVLGNTTPLIQEFTPESSKKIFSSKIMNHVLFFTNKQADHHTSVMANYRDVAGQYKGKALFVNVPSTEQKVLEFFDLTPEQLPAMVFADLAAPSGIKKYKYSGDHSVESIKAFVASYFDGSLKPFLKSEAPQPEDTTGDVVVLRGSSFNDLVLNNDKDVLVKFYAPWCGHCKKLAPVWDELAQQLSEQKNVVIAKMDSTANEVDVPGLAVQGFPTIYFFKGNNKAQPVKYDQGRNLEDFVKYLEENAHHSFVHEEL
jgi:protein disulfide isomerase